MITWKIDGLVSQVTTQQVEGPLVVSVHWRVTAQDGSFAGNVSGQQEIVYDPATDFTPYEDLTETQVLGWVHVAMGDQRTAYEDMVMQQIEQKKAEPIVLPLPWQQPSGNDTLLGGNGNDSLGGLT